ncbi:Permease of the major facilitator superfamily [Pseudomonas sp. R4-39-08]|nr:Permease of the major facilitator superfamily [Pseudomonas sp. R4-39-08]
MSNPTYVQEYNAIVAVLNQYNEGGKQAKSSIMKPAFSEQATIFGVDAENKLTGGPIQGLFDIIDSAFRPSPRPRAPSSTSISLARLPVRASIPMTSPVSALPTFSTC